MPTIYFILSILIPTKNMQKKRERRERKNMSFENKEIHCTVDPTFELLSILLNNAL